MDKHILLPTDFSKNALNAIRYTLDLFSDERCEFYLLHAFTVNGFSLEGSPMTPAQQYTFEHERDRTRVQLEKLMGMVRLHPKNPLHSFHSMVTGRDLLFVAKEIIAQKNISVVALGTKGATNMDTQVFGTKALELMEHITQVPVMAVPPTANFMGIRKIVLPTDYGSPFHAVTLRPLLDMAYQQAASIHVVYISSKPRLNRQQQAIKEELSKILDHHHHSFHILEHDDVAQGIEGYMAMHQSDILVMMRRKQGFFKKWLGQSLIQQLGAHSKTPMLTFHDNG